MVLEDTSVWIDHLLYNEPQAPVVLADDINLFIEKYALFGL